LRSAKRVSFATFIEISSLQFGKSKQVCLLHSLAASVFWQDKEKLRKSKIVCVREFVMLIKRYLINLPDSTIIFYNIFKSSLRKQIVYFVAQIHSITGNAKKASIK